MRQAYDERTPYERPLQQEEVPLTVGEVSQYTRRGTSIDAETRRRLAAFLEKLPTKF